MAGYAPTDPYTLQQYMSLTDPYWDAPQMPSYAAGFDPATMSLAPELDERLNALNLDRSALNQFQQEAMRTGPSKYASLSDKQQMMLAKKSKDENRRLASGTQIAAQGELARTGGLSSGARERSIRDTQRNVMDLNQGVGQTLAENMGKTAMQDEQNRMQMLGQVPGMQMNAANFDLGKIKTYGTARGSDIQNQISENQYKNAFDLNAYNTQGQMWAAKKTAAAQNSGGGTWLCTEAGAYDFAESRELLSLFKKYALRMEPELTNFYLLEGNELLQKMKSDGYNFRKNTAFVDHIVDILKEGDPAKALRVYVAHVFDLIEKHWPECHILSRKRAS